jgi:asparagine synthase (glutamine-hydrolysing)
MCGIAGKVALGPAARIDRGLIGTMLDTIRHRGPDDEGTFVAPGIGFGQRRLSIIDLATGKQPLCNEDGTVWIVFNGEIYNYQELRSYLIARGHTLKTKSDTEVIVHLYEDFGEGCVDKLRGMFAFALWDGRTNTLLLARDRVGIKPLYYVEAGNAVVFASEIKALLADPAVPREIAPEFIDRFLTFFYMPGEETLFRGVYKLPPGSLMVVRDGRATVKQYWDLRFQAASITLPDAERELARLFEECVRMHMIADVPVGFLLSGGVDSTAMLGLAVGKTEHKLSSFTIGFSDPEVTDERPYAALAARTFGSDHHEMTISSADFRDFLPKYLWHMEEPVCEPPAVALYYVSKLASQFVKVLISGEGGDEAFAGYSNYRNLLWFERFKRWTQPLGSPGRSLTRAAASVLGSDRVSKYVPLLAVPFDSYYFSRTSNPFRFFNCAYSALYSPDFLGHVNKQASAEPAYRYLRQGQDGGLVNRMLYVDTKTWLVDDLLIKADKMTMANSVELRVPLLDHKLLEFAASLPGNFKVHNFTTKYIAKRVLQGCVPRQIIERKKAGFPVPYEKWIRGELKDWFRDVLLDRKSIARGYFNRRAIEDLVNANLQTGSMSKEVFSLAVLELWHRTFADPAIAGVPSATAQVAG